MEPSDIADWLDDEAEFAHISERRKYSQAAATIRAHAEALKIATEALDLAYAVRVFLPPHVESEIKSALARIKEVG